MINYARGKGTDLTSSARHPPGRPAFTRSRAASHLSTRGTNTPSHWSRSRFKSGLQHRDRQMLKQRRKRQLGYTGAADRALRAISRSIERAVEVRRARPDPTTLRKRGERFCNGYDRGVAAQVPREGDNMVAMRSAHLQRLIFAVSEDLR